MQDSERDGNESFLCTVLSNCILFRTIDWIKHGVSILGITSCLFRNQKLFGRECLAEENTYPSVTAPSIEVKLT